VDAYHNALHALRATGRVFPCACSRREIEEAGIKGLEGSIYPGTCRNGLPPGRSGRSLRLRVADGTMIEFEDALQGPVRQDLATSIGDFVVYRPEGIFSYHLACVIGDAHQDVTHVVRGADLIDSTPRQIHLQDLLHLPTPAYLHLPVATNERGEKLSKQTRATPVDATNVAPTIHTVLHFLGQHPPPELARWSAAEAIGWAVNAWRRDNIPPRSAIELPLPVD
jgi:glutamyl-Q tRNA(Asp) synthetase